MEQGYHVRADQSLDCRFKKKEKEGFFHDVQFRKNQAFIYRMNKSSSLTKKKPLTFVAASPGHRLQNKIGNPYM